MVTVNWNVFFVFVFLRMRRAVNNVFKNELKFAEYIYRASKIFTIINCPRIRQLLCKIIREKPYRWVNPSYSFLCFLCFLINFHNAKQYRYACHVKSNNIFISQIIINYNRIVYLLITWHRRCAQIKSYCVEKPIWRQFGSIRFNRSRICKRTRKCYLCQFSVS